jgi:hypothetical protein
MICFQAGSIVPATDLATMIKIIGATVPQVSSTCGVVTMVYHQINAGGAGTVTCSVSADATGKTFTAMKVTTQVPGTNGRSTAANANFPLEADMPAGTDASWEEGEE